MAWRSALCTLTPSAVLACTVRTFRALAGNGPLVRERLGAPMGHPGHQTAHDEAGLADHGVVVSAPLQAVRSLARTRRRARCKATSG
jgi:hypothetical protein